MTGNHLVLLTGFDFTADFRIMVIVFLVKRKYLTGLSPGCRQQAGMNILTTRSGALCCTVTSIKYEPRKEDISIMKKLKFLLVLGALLAVIMAQAPSGTQAAQNKPDAQYAVLSPWAEVDPMPLKGLTAPRVNDLAGKKIGLFVNYKRAAMPSAEAVEKQLKARFPNSEFSFYHSRDWNVNVIETNDKEKFAAWVKGQDALVATIGD